MNYLVVNNLLTNVGGKSCSTQLLECMDMGTEIMDKGGYLDVIYLDYAKAFDIVAHQRWLIKTATRATFSIEYEEDEE